LDWQGLENEVKPGEGAADCRDNCGLTKEETMNVPAVVVSRLWELGRDCAYQSIFHDITLLCVAAARDGMFEGRTGEGWQMRDALCETLAQESLAWRGSLGKNAHGLWRAPDGRLVWWTNSDVGCAWCPVEDVARGTLDLLLQDAETSLIDEVRRTGYRRWAA
jgi:hypothetical protein